MPVQYHYEKNNKAQPLPISAGMITLNKIPHYR